MQIRSITAGSNLDWPLKPKPVRQAGEFLAAAAEAFRLAGLAVQTTRLCSQPLDLIAAPDDVFDLTDDLEREAEGAGIAFVALGTVRLGPEWDRRTTADVLARAVAESERVFFSLAVAEKGMFDLAAAHAGARIIQSISRTTPQGFGNLRFAAAANCPPGIPFFPVASHGGGRRRFSLALQAADLVKEAFTGDDSIEAAEARLIQRFSAEVARIEAIASELEASWGWKYLGVDLTPAPYPGEADSIGAALEALGADAFGTPGTLFLCWRLTQALRRVPAKRCGYSGLMLPVLEDSSLALRASEGTLEVAELLLYSSVCGTGLDTVPLPGDISDDELAGTLVDVAALSCALKKPLTARLMPLPGKRAGDTVDFDFPFFTSGRVLAGPGRPGPRLWQRQGLTL